MPKDHFHHQRVTDLSSLKNGARIHFIGVCGVAMGQLALALSRQGYRVSGSDREFYPPMSTLLEESDIELQRGFDEAHITENLDLVVIGNAISYGHCEVDQVEKLDLPYTSFAQLLGSLLLGKRHSIVACGTHGKSTTSALAASVLHNLGENPSYFVGAAIPEFESSLNVTSGGFSVFEGDEYDTAFFAKVPKFNFYRPDSLILTSIEFDHADIYDDEDMVFAQFEQLLHTSGDPLRLIACVDFPRVAQLVESQAGGVTHTYGRVESAATRLLSVKPLETGQQVTFYDSIDDCERSFSQSLIGEHNALNSMGVYLALRDLNLKAEAILSAIGNFQGLRRRQEVRWQGDGSLLIEDFAHHPSAVKETLAALKMRYPSKRLRAVFEPRSSTSRRSFFQQQYTEAFDSADEIVLRQVKARPLDKVEELLDTAAICDALEQRGKQAIECENAADIKAHLTDSLGENDLIVVMSNGSFEGLIDDLVASLGDSSLCP